MQLLERGQSAGHIIKQKQSDGILASLVAYHPDQFNAHLHCHAGPLISFVLKGGSLEKKKNRYERLPGRTTFYQTGEPHQILYMTQSVHISLEMTEAFLRDAGFAESNFTVTLDKTPDARFMMLGVYRELVADDAFSNTSVQQLLLDFLSRAKSWDMEREPGWIKIAYEVMNDRWDETLTLEELSKAAGVHPVTVSAYFPRYFSCTLGAYMRKLKIERALERLKVSDSSLTETAYACGFFDQSHFTRTFKQLTGFLPAQYQKL